jgi:hypothetical protein
MHNVLEGDGVTLGSELVLDGLEKALVAVAGSSGTVDAESWIVRGNVV